ncbi:MULTISPECIES: DUF397 domain-containing protein [Streptomyces]|uniref:DUF397 domain-containing protein n=1 Tax=Streptomyces viridochromogenes TaxID=1938 RepID=A0A0L8KH00_STRVR|nr:MULTISPECIES: DUF397 domain-containing protein [Streptomyces]KOG25160.1 hypothetical protein ADK34_17905 [Streptomyces viridochromogenes]
MNVADTTASALELAWRKSSYSGAEGGQCVEVAVRPGTVYVRDSKDMEGPRLSLAPEKWAAFVEFTAQG